MSDLFDFKPAPTAFAVMGNPVSHSKSPFIHGCFGQQCQITLEYDRIQVDAGGFDQAVSHFSAHGGAGLNITLPFKVEAWELCNRPGNRLSSRAATAGSVNTLKFESDGSVYGDNTDGIGMVRDIENNIGCSLRDKSVLLVGAGGAVRGVVDPLLQCLPHSITITNRTAHKATALANHFDGNVQACALADTSPSGYDVIINGSAASLQGLLPGIQGSCVNSNTLIYDMMYATKPTIFMKWALDCGARSAHDGVGMLVEQAAESFYIWHGQRPETQPVIGALRKQ